ncbi:MAG: U32 family peptidase, partial [Lachnospiraceae bacterium]|nr:U32 family peptidase [Lachnospiraceae bacterium]
PKDKLTFAGRKPYITASVTNREQYDACKRAGIEEIYFDQIVRRNQITYPKREGELLIGGYGGIYAYKDTNNFVTDYSLNVVNATSCYELHKLGAKRVTLSYELNKKQINDLLEAYYEANEGYPSLEMIVYGRAPLLFTKYCPLKKMNQCGICKTKKYEIKDEYGTFPILSHDDCTTTILNGKILNLLDEMPFIEGVEAFRLNFTTESAEEVYDVIKAAQAKLDGRLHTSLFNQETDTRGHFNKEII